MTELPRALSPTPLLGQAEPSSGALEALDRVRRMGEGAHTGGRYQAGTVRAPGGRLSDMADPRVSGPHYSAARADPRDPQPLGADIDELVKDYGWRTKLEIGALLGNWAQLVGTNIAEHCTPEVCEPPKLVVRASSTTWATQLRIMSQTLLDRLERELGKRVIDDITIVGPAQRSWKKGRRSVQGRGPRDTYG